MNSTLLLILWDVQLELVIYDCRYIVLLTLRREQVRGENGESICTIHVKPPIGCGDYDIDYQCISHENINYGKKGAD